MDASEAAADDPAHERDENAHQARVEEQDAAARVPPRHEQQGEEATPSRPEGNRVERRGGAPCTGGDEHYRHYQEDLAGDETDRLVMAEGPSRQEGLPCCPAAER